MQALLCNVCRQPLKGTAYELSTIRGDAVPTGEGPILLANRHDVRLLQLCSRCGEWLQLGMRTVQESLDTARAVSNDPRLPDTTAGASRRFAD